MRLRTSILITLTALIALLSMPAVSSAAAVNSWGSTQRWPWSGSWWPMLDTYTNLYDDGQALSKYDTYIKAIDGTSPGSQAFEKQYFSTSDPKNNWWGHCHAWAAAAILAAEPPTSVTKNGVTFNDVDLKGLVSDLYFDPKLNWLAGTRSETADTTKPEYKDIAPAWMDWLLQYYVGYYRYSFIMDISANSQVWNYPVVAYTRTSNKAADGTETVSTTVWFANPENRRGTGYHRQDYTYTLKAGTDGTWTGASVTTHPDFAWVPTGHNTANTLNGTDANRNHKLDTAKIETLIGGGYKIP